MTKKISKRHQEDLVRTSAEGSIELSEADRALGGRPHQVFLVLLRSLLGHRNAPLSERIVAPTLLTLRSGRRV